MNSGTERPLHALSRLRRLQAAAAALALAAAGLVVAAGPAQAATCSSDTVDLIALNGTNAPTSGSQADDQLGRTLAAIDAKTSYSTPHTYLNYNTSIFQGYTTAVYQGEQKLRDLLEKDYNACHSTKYVLVGYSMGANVVGDTLDNVDTQLPSGLKSQIKAIILYGDPTFVPNKSYDHGTYENMGGAFERSSNALDAFASRIASYCDKNDQWCQFTGTSGAVHAGYLTKDPGPAADFVRSKLGK